jgi:hypothetical protein
MKILVLKLQNTAKHGRIVVNLPAAPATFILFCKNENSILKLVEMHTLYSS